MSRVPLSDTDTTEILAIRFPRGVLNRVRATAREDDRPLGAQIRFIVTGYVEQRGSRKTVGAKHQTAERADR
jgi:hypothetical protein